MNNNENKKNLIHRLKIARGHLSKVISMIEQDEYCIDVVHQSLAVQKALREVDLKILNNHINTCVVDSIKKGNVKEVTKEVISVMDKM